MSASITGIDIGEGHIAAVRVKAGLRGFELSYCARISLENGDIGAGLDRLSDSTDLKADRCLVSIPASQVSFRNLEMPFADAKKIRQTLPYELETLLPYPVEELVTDFIGTRPKPSMEVLSASIRKETLLHYLNALTSHGFDPDALSIRGMSLVPWLLKQDAPDHFLLMDFEDEKATTLFLCEARRVVLIRSFTLNEASPDGVGSMDTALDKNDREHTAETETWLKAMCSRVHHTLHAYESGRAHGVEPERLYLTGKAPPAPETEPLMQEAFGLPIAWVDVSGDKKIKQGNAQGFQRAPGELNAALALVLLDPKRDQHFDFRKNDFAKRRGHGGIKKGVKKGIVFLVLLLGLLGTDMVTDVYFLKRTYERLDAELVHTFRKTLPQVSRIVDPVQQLRVAVNQLDRARVPTPSGTSDKVTLNLLRDISMRVPENLKVTVSRMIIDPETVRLSGKTDTFNAVDSLKSELEPSDFFSQVIISSANLDKNDNRIKFELKLNRNF